MPVDFTSDPGADPTMNESETPMFAPIPTWERNRKRRGFGGRSSAAAPTPAAEPRSFVEDREDRVGMAPMAAGASLGAGAAATEMDATDAPFAAGPLNTDRRTTTVRRNGNGAPMAIAAGLIVLAGVAAAGWYASRPHDTGVAQLTPGVNGAPADIGATTLAQAGSAGAATTPSAADTQAATTHAAPAPTRMASTHMRTTARHTASMSRAASASAADVGVNASATLPAAPVPYSRAARAPAAVAPVTPAPVQPAPAPSATPTPTPGPTDTVPSASPPTTSTPPSATTPTPAPTETPPQ